MPCISTGTPSSEWSHMDTNSSNINTTAELHNPLLLEAKTMESEGYSSDNEKTVRA